MKTIKRKAGNSLLIYIKEIEERIVLRLQIEFPNDNDLVKQIIEDHFSDIFQKLEDSKSKPKMPNHLNIPSAIHFDNKVCHCINWHPSINTNMGKKDKCSYCRKLRH